MATAMETTPPTSTLLEVTSSASATSAPPASTPPTPASNATFEVAVNQLQLQQMQQQPSSRPLITIATQTALRRQDIPTMYHFDFDNSSTNEGKFTSHELEKGRAEMDLTPCPICSRKFNAVSLSKHVGICEKMAMKKRKPFDSSRQRREGTEMAAFLPKNFGLPANKQTTEHLPTDDKFVRSTARSSVRKQSNASTSSNVSVNTTTSATSMPTSPKPTAISLARSRHNSTERPKRSKATPPSSEKCPHCERFFGIKAYDRHVEWCKEKSLQLAMKNSSTTEKDKAKERLVARTKYRAPIKTKRSLNRDKYAGIPGDEYEGDESPKIISNNTLMTSSVASDSIEDDNASELSLEFSDDLERTESSATFVQNAALNSDSPKPQIKEKERTNTPRPPMRDCRNFQNSEHSQELGASAGEAAMPYSSTPLMPYELQSTQFAGNMNFNPQMFNPQFPCNMPNLLLSMQQQQQQLQAAAYQAWLNPVMCGNLYAPADPYNLQMNLHHLNRRHRNMQRKNQRRTEKAANNLPNMPMKAFSMPFDSMECLDTSPMSMDLETLKELELPELTGLHSERGEGDASKSFGSPKQETLLNDEGEFSIEKRHGDVESALINSSYDPFLAAKRQLEELCAPDSPPDNDTRFNTKTLSTPTTPSPLMPSSKMTTSLTLGSTPTPAPAFSSPLTPNMNVRRLNNATTPAATNFRRTSSMRGPRRSPLLPSRPLFAQKRPTIQRGLSDEGPISTNFLKSEEYDEIPVRSVCVNDFAITHSPRVVRRDTSLSNRKNSLKLSFNNHGTREASPSSGGGGAAGMALSSDERLTVINAPKELSKTDSLAVFLKYEKELEKLAMGNGEGKVKAEFPWDTNVALPTNCAVDTTQPKLEALKSKLDAISPTNCLESTAATANSKLAFTKELKDKSNTLSKQNSAKSLKLDNETSMESKQPAPKESPNLPPEQSKHQQIRLEPIERCSQIPQPVSTQNTKRAQTSLPPLSQQSSVTSPTVQTANLELIFSNPKPQQQPQQQPIQPTTSSGSSTYDKENKAISSSTEFIDPKLINKCDNLPVKLADLKFIDSDSSTEQQTQKQQQQQRCDRATDPYERYVAPISQLSKLLPLSNKTNPPNPLMRNAQTQSTPQHTKATATSNMTQQPTSNMQQAQVAAANNNTRRNSIESNNSNSGRNPLKRKMRLGRNQFLYDASPEALDIDSACSADDEANPRSSAEYSPQIHSTFEQMLHQVPHFQANAMAPPPIFDEFDFDEFLSSFEHDEEDFPLFRDCREFLKSRNGTINKQRATTTPHSRNASTPKQIPQTHSNNFFQFPTLDRNLPRLVTPQSNSTTRRSNSKHSIHGFKDMLNDNVEDFYEMKNDDDDDVISGNVDDNSQKREIFISIETEQSDEPLDRNPMSPNSLRNMVGGNPQTLVEVEVDAKDNKFSKISDDDDNVNNNNASNADGVENAKCAGQSSRLLPNVQLNNARNLMQQAASAERRERRPQNVASGVSAGDSDEMSSLDGYPRGSAASFRRSGGVGSKQSADSAYGSLSRQRSNETMGKPSAPLRNSTRTRPVTAAANMNSGQHVNAAAAAHIQQKQFLLQQQYQHQQQQQQMLQQQQQQQLKYAQAMLKGARSRQLSASSSSGSDNSLPPILVANPNHHFQQQQQLLMQQQQQQMSQLYQHNKARSRTSPTASYPTAMDLLNANHPMTSSTGAATATAKPMSRFCHECGSKFMIEQAKFCMDCGVKRLMI